MTTTTQIEDAPAKFDWCQICGEKIHVEKVDEHYGKHCRAAVGDEDNRGGAPRP